jgi:hypothetical protein
VRNTLLLPGSQDTSQRERESWHVSWLVLSEYTDRNHMMHIPPTFFRVRKHSTQKYRETILKFAKSGMVGKAALSPYILQFWINKFLATRQQKLALNASEKLQGVWILTLSCCGSTHFLDQVKTIFLKQ